MVIAVPGYLITHRATALALVIMLGFAACSDSQPNAESTGSASSETTAASATDAVSTYATKFFTPPLDVAGVSFLNSTPDEDSSHFVTFTSADGENAVRILNPVAVYLPGSTSTSVVPADYIGYLTGLSAIGATL